MKRTFTCVRKTLLALSITTISLIFATSCFMGGSGDSEVKYDDPTFPGEHTSEDLSNIILHIDFDHNETHKVSYRNSNVVEDGVFNSWFDSYRPYEALKDKHKNVCQLKKGGAESSISFTVNVTEPSAMTFQFRPNTSVPNDLYVSIDGNENPVPYTPERAGIKNVWMKVKVSLAPGKQTIKIRTKPYLGYSTATFYIDDITISPNKVQSVDIYPKGLQETFVGGNKIKFTAVPLRGDRSTIDKQNISYSVSGCGSITNDGIFTPTSEGECTVTAYVNGIPYKKSNIVVHGRDYLLDPIKIGNKTFNGNGVLYNWDDRTTTSNLLNGIYNISTDGFFVLKGYTSKPLWVQIVKQERGQEYKTHYYIRDVGEFTKRIWLRFGEGKYKVSILDMSIVHKETHPTNSSYEGEIMEIQGYVLKKLEVINTNTMSLEDSLALIPSEVVQSDNYELSNIAHSIVADLPKDCSVSDVLRSIHDWEIHHLYYDTESLNDSVRKRQDALHTARYGMGVCEGYANLYAALCRAVGIKTKVIGGDAYTSSGNSTTTGKHAWNNVRYRNNWYLVDATFDDPVFETDLYNKHELAENYKYFMVNPNDSKHHNTNTTMYLPRSIIAEDNTASWNYYSDGWY